LRFSEEKGSGKDEAMEGDTAPGRRRRAPEKKLSGGKEEMSWRLRGKESESFLWEGGAEKKKPWRDKEVTGVSRRRQQSAN